MAGGTTPEPLPVRRRTVPVLFILAGAAISIVAVVLGIIAVPLLLPRILSPNFDKVGGTRLVYKVDRRGQGAEVETDRLLRALRLRIDPSGYSGFKVTALPGDRVEILLTAVTDPEVLQTIQARITVQGLLEFRILASEKHDHAAIRDAIERRRRGEPPPEKYEWLKVESPDEFDPHAGAAVADGEVLTKVPDEHMLVTGDDIRRAFPTQDNQLRPAVGLVFNARGAHKFARLTRGHQPEPDGFQYRLAIILDSRVMSAPVIQTPIEGGYAQITGGRNGFTTGDVDDLVAVLNAGRLPANLLPEPELMETVGPLHR